MVNPINPTTIATTTQLFEENIAIKTIKHSRGHRSLADSVMQGEQTREGIIPPYISKLVPVNNKNEAQENRRNSSIKEFDKECAVF